MPLSLPIGLLVGALTLIPFVGAVVGAGIAIVVTVADGASPQTVALVVAVIVTLHLLEAGVLTPKIVGHRVGLSESGALFAVVAGGKLLGFVGVVLAVPIAATAAVLVRCGVRYYEHSAFFGSESDGDVVITPAMAIIMPGMPPGAQVAREPQDVAERTSISHNESLITSDPMNIDLPPHDMSASHPGEAGVIDPELGSAGAPNPPNIALPNDRSDDDR